jgi:PKD repeat protein
VNLSRVYLVIIRYTPEDDPVNGKPNGANPCWLILQFSSGKEIRLHHTFNVKQPKSYVWNVNLTQEVMRHGLTFQAEVYDPGADDITLYWDFGDGTNITKSFPNQNNTYPVMITDVVTHAFQSTGNFTVTLTVKDDDGGMVQKKVTIKIGDG